MAIRFDPSGNVAAGQAPQQESPSRISAVTPAKHFPVPQFTHPDDDTTHGCLPNRWDSGVQPPHPTFLTPASSHKSAPVLPPPVGRRHSRRNPNPKKPQQARSLAGAGGDTPCGDSNPHPTIQAGIWQGNRVLFEQSSWKTWDRGSCISQATTIPDCFQATGITGQGEEGFYHNFLECFYSICETPGIIPGYQRLQPVPFLEYLNATAPKPWNVGAEGILGIL